jgi:hypothetical protein
MVTNNSHWSSVWNLEELGEFEVKEYVAFTAEELISQGTYAVMNEDQWYKLVPKEGEATDYFL